MKSIIAHIYAFFGLLKIMICYSKEQIEVMYLLGLIGTEEGQIMRKVFRK